MITLCIDEEYGYRTWIAELTEEEYQQLLARWATMRGLSCLVPVKLIIPQAKEVDEMKFLVLPRNPPKLGTKLGAKPRPVRELYKRETILYDKRCHIHECGDSHLDGSDYKIPEDENHEFWIEGVKYDDMSLFTRNQDGGIV